MERSGKMQTIGREPPKGADPDYTGSSAKKIGEAALLKKKTAPSSRDGGSKRQEDQADARRRKRGLGFWWER